MKLGWIQGGVGLCLSLCLSGLGQAPPQPVHLTAAVTPKPAAEPGSRIAIEVTAAIDEGWHVYGLEQTPGGPTPLRATLDENETVQAAGAATGSAPSKQHDSSFNLETETYTRTFVLRLPAQIMPHAPAGKQLTPVSVRFQACNDRICLPPRTVHLSAPVEIVGRN